MGGERRVLKPVDEISPKSCGSGFLVLFLSEADVEDGNAGSWLSAARCLRSCCY